MNDLWGNPIAEVDPPPDRRHAATPGTGPAGETCRTCIFRMAIRPTGNRIYHKCSLVRITGGPGTDIRLKTEACRKWKQREIEKGATNASQIPS